MCGSPRTQLHPVSFFAVNSGSTAQQPAESDEQGTSCGHCGSFHGACIPPFGESGGQTVTWSWGVESVSTLVTGRLWLLRTESSVRILFFSCLIYIQALRVLWGSSPGDRHSKQNRSQTPGRDIVLPSCSCGWQAVLLVLS